MVVYPNIIKIPKEWQVLRDTVQPKNLYPKLSFGKTFDETYDYDTLFSGVIRHNESTVIFVAPPFLNLKSFIQNNVVVNDGFKNIDLIFYDLDRCSIAVTNVDKNSETIKFYFEDNVLEIPIEDNHLDIFSGEKTLFTMIKNDPKEWILNWINYHNLSYGINRFVIFSNGSDKYSCEELEEFLASSNYEVYVVHWPLKWGVNGPPWDSDFCKIVALQYLKYKFAISSKVVINLDIDEYFVSNYDLDEIINSMEEQNKDTINIESKNISRYSTKKSTSLNDYYWYHTDDVDTNKMIKWITLPKYSGSYPWSTHFVFSPNSDKTEEFYYAHMSILTGEHHIKNATSVYEQRFIIREDGNKVDKLLKQKLENIKPLLF